MMPLFAKIALGLLLGTALSLGPEPSRAADPIELTAILPLTGGASFLGKSEQQSMQLVEKLVNDAGGIQGRPLKILFQDDQTSPQIAEQLATQAIARHPPIIFGPAQLARCTAMT